MWSKDIRIFAIKCYLGFKLQSQVIDFIVYEKSLVNVYEFFFYFMAILNLSRLRGCDVEHAKANLLKIHKCLIIFFIILI